MPDIVTPPLITLLTGLAAYLLGSVPFGIVITRAFGLGDLRSIGSGNIGATNVLRTGSKTAAALTLVLDAGKGAIAVLVARAFLAEDAVQMAAFGAFLGHCFSVFVGFRGGKGVATFLGTALALAPLVGIGACLVWLAAAALTRISSVAALASAAGTVAIALLVRPDATALFVALAALLCWRHRPNIERLMAGTEPRIGR